MAALMGGLHGNRGEVTRLGSKNSGIHAWLKSWKTRVVVFMFTDDTVRIETYSIDGKTLPKIILNGKEIS